MPSPPLPSVSSLLYDPNNLNYPPYGNHRANSPIGSHQQQSHADYHSLSPCNSPEFSHTNAYSNFSRQTTPYSYQAETEYAVEPVSGHYTH